MKKLINALIVVAVLNLLALLAGAGWIFGSGRLSKDRVNEIKSILVDPVEIEEARLKAEQAQADKELAEQEKPLPEIPLNARERNQVRIEMTQVDRQRHDRTKQDVQSMQLALRKDRKAVEDQRVQLHQERADFEAMRERLAELEGTEQFKKSLDTLSGMAAKDSTKLIMAMLNESKEQEVLSYLSSMDGRARSQIMTQMVKNGEDQLAADLLESLRVHGLVSDGTQETNE